MRADGCGSTLSKPSLHDVSLKGNGRQALRPRKSSAVNHLGFCLGHAGHRPLSAHRRSVRGDRAREPRNVHAHRKPVPCGRGHTADARAGGSCRSRGHAGGVPARITVDRSEANTAVEMRRRRKRDGSRHALWLSRARPIRGRVSPTIRRKPLGDAAPELRGRLRPAPKNAPVPRTRSWHPNVRQARELRNRNTSGIASK